MGFFKDLEDSFLEGMRRPRSVPLFGVTAKKAASPIDPARLSAQYRSVRGRLSLTHRKLVSRLTEHLGGDIDSAMPLAPVFAHITAARCFWFIDIDEPPKKFLYQPLVDAIQGIVSTDPKFQPLTAPDIHDIPVDDHFALSEKLRDLETFLPNAEKVIDVCGDQLYYFGAAVLDDLPELISHAGQDIDLTLSTQLIETLAEPHEHLAMTLRHFIGIDADEFRAYDLLVSFREKMIESLLAASGLTVEDLDKKDFDTPLNHLNTPASELTTQFLGKSPLSDFFLTAVPYAL